ncbi:MAG TPA: SDR family NAD(P)-dependent oxidoreductase, partial [Spirochaetota bacterium]|nr:SDR family NAD(P)-dependent oxidoreductase [Spirochaetota bacterium]
MSTKEGCEFIIRDAKKIAGTFEILINNNSIFSAGKFEDEKPEVIKKIIDVNVTGTILLTKLSMSTLKSNKKPGIINICSFYGKVGMPYFSVYASTKFAIAGFTESLQREYQGEPLRIMGVYTSGIKGDSATQKVENMSKLGFTFEEPTEVAKKIVDGYNELQKEIVLGKKERGLIFWNVLRKKSVDESIKKIKPKILTSITE